MLRAMEPSDWSAVETIYAAGIATGHATFETTTPTWEPFTAGKLTDHRFVASDLDRAVLGWAAVSPVSDRCAYAGVVENSVYVAPEAAGRGVGRALLDTVIASTEAAGIWTVQAGIFAENTASLALHAAAGFRTVGVRERLGQRFGVWRDVVLVERRTQEACV